MEETHQISFDELVLQDKIKASPGRTSYIDEYGSFGFDFSTEGASKYYVLCAVIVEDSKMNMILIMLIVKMNFSCNLPI